MRLKFVLLPIAAVAVIATVPLASQTIRRGLPVAPGVQSEDVLVLREFDPTSHEAYGTMLAAHGLDLRRRIRHLAELALVDAADTRATLQIDTRSTGNQALDITEVTADAPRILGLPVIAGRAFDATDLLADSRVGMLTHSAWQRYFGGSLSVLGGRGAIVAAARHERVIIVGVLGPSAVVDAPELAPATGLLILSRSEFEGARDGDRWYAPVLRLRPGISAGDVQPVLDEAAADLRRQAPGADLAFRLESLRRK